MSVTLIKGKRENFLKEIQESIDIDKDENLCGKDCEFLNKNMFWCDFFRNRLKWERTVGTTDICNRCDKCKEYFK